MLKCYTTFEQVAVNIVTMPKNEIFHIKVGEDFLYTWK